MELENLTISKALSLLKEGEITALQLTEFYLNSNLQLNSWFNDLKDTLLIFSIFVSLFLLRDLFSSKNLPGILVKKYFRFIFYITSSFVFIYLIANFKGFYEPSIILGCFILIWVNDSFAYIVGKSFGKQKLLASFLNSFLVFGFFLCTLFFLSTILKFCNSTTLFKQITCWFYIYFSFQKQNRKQVKLIFIV